MESLLQEHGVLFVLVAGFLYGINFPCPLGVLLMAAGSLARDGRLSWFALMIFCPLGILLGEQPWFFLGRKMGLSLLRRLAFFSKDSDAWVQGVSSRFVIHGPKILLTGRFVPGIPACVVPLAGMTGVSWPRFFAWDLASTVVFTVSYSLFGNFLSMWFSTGQIVALAIALLVLGHGSCWFVTKVRRNREFPSVSDDLPA